MHLASSSLNGNKKYTNNQIFNIESGVAFIILVERNLQYYGNGHDNELRSLKDIDVIRNSGSNMIGAASVRVLFVLLISDKVILFVKNVWYMLYCSLIKAFLNLKT